MQHRDLDAVAGREREPLEQLAPRGDLARQRLAEPGQLGIEQRAAAGAPCRWLTRPPPSATRHAAALERPPVEGLDEAPRRARRPAARAGRSRSARREAPRCRRPGSTTSSLSQHRERAPHRVALAQHRPERGQQLGLLVDLGAGARGDLGGAVGRAGVDDHDLVDAPCARAASSSALDDRPRPSPAHSRAGRHTETARASRSAIRSGEKREWWKLRCRYHALRGVIAPTIASRGRRTCENEPWDALLEAGRADGRLVREATRAARRAATEPPAGRAAPRACATRCARAGIDARCTSHQAEALGRAWPRARRSSPPAPPRASRCASTCPRSTCCAATAAPGRCTCTRPRRWPRTRRGRCTRSGCTGSPPGDLRRRHAARASARRSASAPTSSSPTPTCCTSGSCPTTRAWGDLFANLAVVVVDEAHVYRGVFGSHVANVLRRLRRLAAAYGTAPRFLLASATIANPVRAGRAADGPRGLRAGRPRRLARRPSAGSRCGTRR